MVEEVEVSTEVVEDLDEVEEDSVEAEVVEDLDGVVEEGVLTDSKIMDLLSMLLHWESSCIHVKMTLSASAQQRKTRFPISMPQCTWKTRSRLGRWMRYLANSETFISQ